MAVNYSNAAKDARMTAVRDQLNSGTLEIGTSGMGALLVTLNLDASSGSVASAVLTLAGFPKTSAAGAGGVAAAARLRDNVSGDVITGLTVGTSGTDIILDNTNIANGQDVTINSATVTHS